jgi:hypothetical protein
MQFLLFWYLSHFVSFCLILSHFLADRPSNFRENEGGSGGLQTENTGVSQYQHRGARWRCIFDPVPTISIRFASAKRKERKEHPVIWDAVYDIICKRLRDNTFRALVTSRKISP